MPRSIAHDERKPEEVRQYPLLIGGTDRILSGWGKAESRPSYAFWACRPEDAYRVERWVRRRGDIQRVREVTHDYRPSTDAHVTVYVCRDGHPALSA